MGGGGRGGSSEKTRAVEENARAFHSDFVETAAALARTAKMEAIVVCVELVLPANGRVNADSNFWLLMGLSAFFGLPRMLRFSPNSISPQLRLRDVFVELHRDLVSRNSGG